MDEIITINPEGEIAKRFEAVEARLAALESPAGGWVSMEERMPEIEQLVLVYSTYGYGVMYRRANTENYLFSQGSQVLHRDDIRLWHPLPPLPAGVP